ncbi:MAG TPA: hypothetical protein VGG48_17780 [Rhizomicrobium sp.]|jgi:hypothetical protein
MSWVVSNIVPILIVCGAATCSMLLFALMPRRVSGLVFGEEISSPAALLVARSWGLMIFTSGVLLVASAYHPEIRDAVLINAIAGKLGFVLLVFAGGGRYLARPAFAMALIDLVMIALFACYLAG